MHLSLSTSLQALERLTITDQRKGHPGTRYSECRHKKPLFVDYAISLNGLFLISKKPGLTKRIFEKG